MDTRHAGAALITVGALLLVGCGSSANKSTTASTTRSTSGSTARPGSGPTATANASSTSGAAVSTAVADILRQAVAEERTVESTYSKVLATYPGRNPFANILLAERQHITALETAAANHGVDVSSATGTAKATPATFTAACQLGVQLEQEDIALYNTLLPKVAAYPDLTKVFESLQSASREHLAAFQKCA